MGHETSKLAGPSTSTLSDFRKTWSYRERVKMRLKHTPHPSSSSPRKGLKEEDFAGIALIRFMVAEIKFEDKWFACISFGEQTFRTQISDHTNKPIWNSEHKLLLERQAAHVARISVFQTNPISKNNLVGYCEIDLFEFLTKDSASEYESFELLDPSSTIVVGSILISFSIDYPVETEKCFARRIVSIVDYDEDGKLSFTEFCDLINAFGNELATNKKEELFQGVDEDRDGVVSVEELAIFLAVQQERWPLLNCCPVCGENIDLLDRLNSMIHLTLCFDEGTGDQVMTGGFLTDKQAANGWMFIVSEWAEFSSYEVGLRSGSSGSNILVFDREKKRIVEELIDGK